MDPENARGGIIGAVIIPTCQAVITGCSLGAVTFSLGLIMAVPRPDQASLLVASCTSAVTWIALLKRWLQVAYSENVTQRYTARVRVEVSGNGGRSLQFIDLPANEQQLLALANGVLSGATLSEGAWSGSGRPFTRAEFRALRDELIRRNLATWRNPEAPAQGVELTLPGKAIMRRFASMAEPSPTLKPGQGLDEY